MALLTVTEAFADFSAGYPEVYANGRLVDENDPVVKGRERHFEAADVLAARLRVETATAGPGERRTRSRAAKKAAKKAPAKPAKKAAAKTPAPAPADPPQGDASSEVL